MTHDFSGLSIAARRWVPLALLICFAAGCRHRPQANPSDNVRAYFQAKERYDSARLDSSSVEAALRDLGARARIIVGPVSIAGQRGTFNLEWLPSGDPHGMLLDGFAFADALTGTTTIVTTPELLRGWLRLHGDSSGDPLVNVAHEDRLTWVFWQNAHVYPFADIKAKASLPDDVFLALMVGRSNDTAHDADEIIVGVRRGNLVYLMIAPAEAMVTAPASCGSPLADELHRKCFDAHAAAHPEFPKVVAQVRAMRARLP